jgi:hypothetical protein
MTQGRPIKSRIDLILLPCLSILTVLLLCACCEAVCRHFLLSNEKDACIVPNANIGYAFKPNCNSRVKIAESSWVDYHYNDCGYRSAAACATKLSGSIRIALLGSSGSKGEYVNYDHTFATRTERQLSSRCGRIVDVQNLGRKACTPVCAFHRMEEALALRPDILILSISPHDLELMQSSQVVDRYKAMPAYQPAVTEFEKTSRRKKLQKLLTESSSVVAAEHFMFQDPAAYLKMYLNYGDNADYLRTPFSGKWQQRFADFDLLLGEMAQKAQAADVPFYLVEIPSLAQVSILSLKTPPADVDAAAINRELAAIAGRHGVRFVDVLDEFQRTPGSNKFFYMVDGHLNGDGEALISAPLVEKLIDDNSPAVAGCGEQLQTATLGKGEGQK